MKAVVADHPGGPDVLQWTEVPVPEVAADECLVRVEACGACMHEVLVRRGDKKVGVKFPVIPGHEVVGVVTAVGDDVEDFAIGDRVVTSQRQRVCGKCRECRYGRESRCAKMTFLGDVGLNGGYAEFVSISDGSLVRLPPSVTSNAVAVAACGIGTQLNALRDVAQLRIGETVLVTGAGGGVGLHAVQLARAFGARVLGQTTSAEKVEAVRAAGAHEVVLSDRGADFSGEVARLTSQQGCDVVLENVGSPSFPFAVQSLAMHGRLVIVGEVKQNPPAVEAHLTQWRARDLTIRGAASTTRKQVEEVVTLVERGLVVPTVTQTLPMSEAGKAHQMLEDGSVTGRLLLIPDNASHDGR